MKAANEYKLREYQERAIEKLRHSFATGHRRPVLQLPTGSGKTVIAMNIIKSGLGKGSRVMFIIDRLTLITQTSNSFTKAGLEHGVIQGDHPMRNDNLLLQLCSVQTLVRRKLIKKPDLLIVDEAHSVYKSFIDLIQGAWSDVPIVALSATPWTKGLGKIYDDLITVETTQGLIKQEYLSDFDCYGPQTVSMKGVKSTAGDYNNKEMGEKFNKPKITGSVIDTWLRLGDNRQTICFSVNVAHSKAIVDELKSNHVSAEHIDAFTSEEDRIAILGRHDSGETKVVCNCAVLTKGFDSPNSSCLIYARSTKSLQLHIQILGRVLRKSDDNQRAIILDHGGNIARLGFPTDQLPEFLCNGDKEETKQKLEEEKKEKLPTPCEKCSYMSIEFTCPACGHTPLKMPGVEAKEGELKKIERVDMKEKIRIYAELKGYAAEKGYKPGWAYHAYFARMKIYPTRTKVTPALKPSKDTLNWITHRNIKRAKGSRYKRS